MEDKKPTELEKPTEVHKPVVHKGKKEDKKWVDFSKYLSFVLRHGAKEVGVTMDKEGYVEVDAILKTKNGKFSLNDVKYVVETNNKKRFELTERDNGQGVKKFFIRAVQGHTITGLDEDSLFEEIKDPKDIPFIIHGTDYKAWINFIRFQGLKKMARNHIHFAIGFNNESHVVSGMRNSSDIIIEVDAAKAMKDGYKFLRSKNDVILSPGKGDEGQMPPAYFKNVLYRKPGKDAQAIKLDLSPFDYLLILDFEANCVETGGLPCQEIIEFPIVPVDVKNMKIMQDSIYHSYIKPTVVPKITDFCTKLTGIKQETVDQGIKIEEALKQVDDWMTKNGFNGQNSTFVTCGRWDLNTCLKNEAKYKNIVVKDYLRKYINIKDAWCCMNFTSKATGMDGMLKSYNLTLDGHHHSGIDDSKNIAKIALQLLKEGAAFSKMQELTTNYDKLDEQMEAKN